MEIAKIILEYAKILVWPLTAIFLGIYFRRSLIAILARLEKATLPGGISLDFNKEVKQIEALSERVQAAPAPKQLAQPDAIEASTANKIMIQKGLTPVQSNLNVSYFRDLADRDPVLAIAALRIEMEILAKNLFVACKLPMPPIQSATMLIRRLSEQKLINESQTSLAMEIIKLCNRVVHGKEISRQSANKVFSGVSVLYLDYLLWLSTK